MKFLQDVKKDTLHGVLFVALFAVAAIEIANIHYLQQLAISPLLVGIVIGMFYALTLRNHLPASWVPGILFSAKRVLRIAIILYGFRLSFQQIIDVGWHGLLMSTFMLATTLIIGSFIGIKIFKLDRDTSILVAAGSAICGAAAVMATETVLEAKPYKSAVAVATVVLFGTLAMFIYPAIYATGALHLDPTGYGLFVGSTVHEVAQVVAAGSAVTGAASIAIVVKMTRVMLLAPMLIILGLILKKGQRNTSFKSIVPWFALGFIAMVGFNSFHLLPMHWVDDINQFDTFLLTMAMTALGMETNTEKFKAAGLRPILLATALFVWLFFGGLTLLKLFGFS